MNNSRNSENWKFVVPIDYCLLSLFVSSYSWCFYINVILHMNLWDEKFYIFPLTILFIPWIHLRSFLITFIFFFLYLILVYARKIHYSFCSGILIPLATLDHYWFGKWVNVESTIKIHKIGDSSYDIISN